jgi:hypothetical protein
VDQNWIDAAPGLMRDGWGIVPIYFGLQLIDRNGHSVPPPADPLGAAHRDATEATTLASHAKLQPGQTIYIDVETTFPHGGAYEQYLEKWIELVQAAGLKVALYCHKAQLPWAQTRGLNAWTVHLNAETGWKDPRTQAIHWSYLTAPLPADPIDAGAVGTQTRFFCRAGTQTLEIDYDQFRVPDPSHL